MLSLHPLKLAKANCAPADGGRLKVVRGHRYCGRAKKCLQPVNQSNFYELAFAALLLVRDEDMSRPRGKIFVIASTQNFWLKIIKNLGFRRDSHVFLPRARGGTYSES